jgi:hypothetical protein
MTSYQNVPEAPAFQGANALVSMLSNPNLFRDLSGLDANQANALQALITAANSAQGFTQQASNMANTAAGLNSQKMKQDHQEKMDKQKFAQQNYDKIKTNLDDQKKNGSITPEEYDKRLKELNDLTLGGGETPTTGTGSNPATNSTGTNNPPTVANTIGSILNALDPQVALALANNTAFAGALAQLVTGGNFTAEGLSSLIAQYANSADGTAPVVP